MPRDRSIRNIPLPSATNRRQGRPIYEEDEVDDNKDSRKPPTRVKLPHKGRSRWWIWLILLALVCAVAGLLLSTLFESAHVSVAPKEFAITQAQTLTAQPGGPTGTLLYQTLTASQSASTSVAANGTQHVSRPATGVVSIFNAYSTAPQPLSANTRLTTVDGKIYRIKTAITVPGATKSASGSLTPNSTTVSVYADAPGDSYNTQSAIQLHILGFKGTAKYDKFVVQSQGPISGGFIGDEPAIAAADLANAQDQLKKELDQSIRSVATTQVPDGDIEVNGSLGLAYTDITQTPGPNNTVTLSQGVTATLVVLNSKDLAAALAKEAVPNYNGEAIAFADPTAVDVTIANSGVSTGPLQLSVGGSPTLAWQVDTAAVQKALLGQKKSDFIAILQQFGNVVECTKDRPCTASVRPFWRATFPEDPGKLTVTLTK